MGLDSDPERPAPEPPSSDGRRGRPGGIAGAASGALYDGVVLPAARAFLAAAGLVSPKIAAYREARRDWRAALHGALRVRPDLGAGDALWVHGASAGEFVQGRALLAALRERVPAAPLVYTFTSPSAAPLVEGFRGADLVFPLPLDTRRNVRDWLDIIRPAALALVDAELWPNLVTETERRGIPVALVSARLGQGSRRLRFPVAAAYRGLYARLSFVGAVNGEAAERLRDVGAPDVRVSGDLRVDETLRRAAGCEASPGLPLPPILPVVVAGSTWPDDEKILLPALERLRDEGVFFGVVIAPHDVREPRLREVERALDRHGFTPARYGDHEEPEGSRRTKSGRPGVRLAERTTDRGGGFSPPPEAGAGGATIEPAVDALLVARVGLLYRLYAHAGAAYVGGGFRGRLHNVMEPAAFGVPVLTGPRIGSSWIAVEMRRACGLFPVADPPACAAAFEHLLAEDRSPARAGGRARDVLAGHAGAVERTLEALADTGWLPQEQVGAATSPKK